MLFSSRVRKNKDFTTINDAIQQLLSEKPNNEIKELCEDYQKRQLWKPQKERYSLFPKDLRIRIYYFVLSVRKFTLQYSKLQLPKPLRWIIINFFIKN